jgi:predicted permease
MAVALDITLDVRVLAFAAAITLAVGILFGILPALEAARSPAPLLRESATRVTRLRLRHGLVVVQVAASLVLLVAGGLFLRSLLAVQQVDTGFEAENMVLMSFDPTIEGLSEEQAQLFYGQLVERAAALPGVRAVTLAETVPLGLGWSRRSIDVEGYEPRPGEDMEWPFNGVLAGYFETMGIRLVQGRAFTPADREGAPLVAIVNQAFARRFWPGRNPLGQRFGTAGSEGPFMEVVGVVPDGKYRSFTEEPTPYFYYPSLQHPRPGMTLHARLDGDAAPVVGALRREVRALAPALAPLSVTTLRQHLASTTMPQRIAALMLGVLGGLALLIAAVGLYGVISYAVAQRTREFGIRMALGALAGDVRSMVLRQGMRITAVGLLIGSGIAAAVAWVIRGYLLIEPFDPVTFVAVPLLLAGAAAFASWIPARRATRADPLAAIRTE